MRTTVTLDDDVVAKLRDRVNASGSSFKDTINACLRQGLESSSDEGHPQPFVVKARPMGLRPGFDLSDVGGLLDILDGPVHP